MSFKTFIFISLFLYLVYQVNYKLMLVMAAIIFIFTLVKIGSDCRLIRRK